MPAIARCLLFIFSVLVASGAAFAEDVILPGHSRHGEIFDSGLRQSAYLMGGTGNVHFPITHKVEQAQKFFEQGVGQLHGFWYAEAERSFRAAQALDPTCAGMAWWGVALASHYRPSRAKQFGQLAAKNKAGLTEREKMYIDALTSEAGYRALMAKYPDDLEAKAREVWRIWYRLEAGQAPQTDVATALDLASQILKVNKLHPINHAVIHICNMMSTESRALDSADNCGASAPSIGHMWHMPTHIYFTLHRYPQAAWQLEASIRTEHARQMHDRVIPDQSVFYAHNNEWLVRCLLYMGRVRDARMTAEHMMNLPRHPQYNLIEPPEEEDCADNDDSLRGEKKIREAHGTSAYYGRDRLLQTLRQFELWDELIDKCKSNYLEETSLPSEQGKIHLNLGVAYYSTGDVAAGDRELAEVRRLREVEESAAQTAVDEASESSRRNSAIAAAQAKFAHPLSELSHAISELESYRRLVTGFYLGERALIFSLGGLVVAEIAGFFLLRRRSMIVAVLTIPVAIGVGVWLFEAHLALIDLPYNSVNVDFAFMSRRMLESGDPDVAEWCAQQFAENREYQVKPQANLVEILYRIGKKDEAREEFEKLRELGGMTDLDSPAIARLQPIARDFGLPTDWRQPEKLNKPISGRRPLKSLGPLVWRPWVAPDWKLKDAQGREHTLAEYRGKPLLMVFFLGIKCDHCTQQLKAFAKKAEELKKDGITLIAVNVDDPSAVKKALDDFKPGPFPFVMLSDDGPKNTHPTFEAYRAYDNFEGTAMHGTFLIDGEGYCRWFDVSYEPFMDVTFLIGESKRLLSRPVPPIEQGARIIADTKDGVPVSSR
jgi:peroxiredoxin